MRDKTKNDINRILKNKRLIFANQDTKEKEFWLQKLKGKPTTNAFPFDVHGSADLCPVPAAHLFQLEGDIFSLLTAQAGGSDYKLHIILMAGFILLLRHYTGNNHIVVVTPVYKPKTRGEFINTVLPITIGINNSITFRDLLKETAAALKEAAEHRDYPVDLVPEKLVLTPWGHYSMFDAAVLMENLQHKYHLQPIIPRVSLIFKRCDRGIRCQLEYDTVLYKKTFIREVVENFRRLLETTLQNPDEPIPAAAKAASAMARDDASMSNTPRQWVHQPPRDEIEKKLVQIWGDVLEIDSSGIGIDDFFFELDGQSLKAIMMSAKIHKVFNISIPLAKIFELSTVRELANHIKEVTTGKQEEINTHIPVQPMEQKEYYPLSPAQKRMYIAQQMQIGLKSYNTPRIVRLEGLTDRKKLIRVFLQLVQRHENLRTSFIKLGDNLVQCIRPHVDLTVEYYRSSESESQPVVKNFIRPFELHKPPLVRFGLIDMGEAGSVLMLDMHHIISDGFSFSILVREFVDLYNGRDLLPLKIQYRDFAAWQNRLIRLGIMDKQKAHWVNKFKEENIPALNIPTDYPRPAVRDISKGDHIVVLLDKPLCKKIFDFIHEAGVTLSMFLLAVYYILLSRYSGQEDIVVGLLVTGRSSADLENVMGMFVNLLALRNFPRSGKTFKQFLLEIKENAIKAYENQDYPFDDLVVHLGLQGDSSRNPLFDVVFDMNNLNRHPIDQTGLQVKPYENTIKFAKFDLYLQAIDMEGIIQLLLRYSTQLLKASTIQRLLDYYTEILVQVVENPGVELDDIVLSHRFLTSSSTIRENDPGDFNL